MYHQRNTPVAGAHNSTNCKDVDSTVFVIRSALNRSRNESTNLYLNSLLENVTVHSLVLEMLRGERSRLIVALFANAVGLL